MSEPTLPATEVSEDTLILSRSTLGKDLMGFWKKNKTKQLNCCFNQTISLITGNKKMKEIKREELPSIGSKLAGGYYTGIIQCGETQFAIITSPKSIELNGKWGEYGQQIEGCNSVNDCHANTKAMAESGSEIAQKVLAIEFDGFNDWAIPSRDALELQYRHFKPTEQENYCSYRDGDNPSSVPPGHLYTKENPLQTTVDLFKDGNAEAFDDVWHWSSTQYSSNYAYVQDFSGGGQVSGDKFNERRVRPVRRLVIC